MYHLFFSARENSPAVSLEGQINHVTFLTLYVNYCLIEDCKDFSWIFQIFLTGLTQVWLVLS